MSCQSEGMAVLAWALGCAELPAVHVECQPMDITNGMGFLGERSETPLHFPQMREWAQIKTWANTYVTLHWRLREFSLRPITIDFVDYVSKGKWASLPLEHLEIQDKDLAIGGVRLDKLESHVFRRSLGITHERHTAFNLVAGIRAYLFRSDCRYLSLTPTI